MKVLMLGWEFPPHITGGLGTACLGLTHALNAEGVEIVFVVPRAYGDEPAAHVSLVDASEVPVRDDRAMPAREPESSTHTFSGHTFGPGEVATRGCASLELVMVPSSLVPYHSVQSHHSKHTLRHWNYTFFEDASEDERATKRATDITIKEGPNATYTTYTFSGQYGGNLLEETERYAQVCAALAARHRDVDILHAHDWMTFPAGVAAKKASGKPLLVHVHSTEFDRSGDTPQSAILEIEKAGLEHADHIVAVSRWTKNILIERYRIPAKKITVSHNGVVQKNFDFPPEVPAIGSHVVTFLGRLTYQKGPLYFVDAAFRVLEKFPDAHFVVAGSGDLLPRMVEQVAHLRLSSRFHFTGFLGPESVEKIWAISDVYVMPSVSEPFGITPLEASQAGIPVIVSRQSGVSEVMSHAIKVDFWDAAALADAICNVLAYAGLSATLRKNSLMEIKRITWEKAAKKINTLYHDLTT